MSSSAKPQSEPIRMVFELSREDHPRLYDELIRFPKGTKRINRLRVLAYDGLLAQVGRTTLTANNENGETSDGGSTEGSASLTNDLFGPSIRD